MCGLIGYTSNGVKANPYILRKLMKANDSRGGHSTGYFDGNQMSKVIGKSDSLQMPKRCDMFIGHTRYATHGKKVVENQHPFKYGKVVGAHNGVVHNYREVGEQFGLKKTAVDSQMIFKVMNKENGELNILGKFSGALATLFTLGDGRLYTYRKTNPLWVGRDSKGGVYFSSLRDVMIECKLNNIFQLKEGRVYIWEDGVVKYKIDIDHDPVESKYGAVKKQWWEYGRESFWTPEKSPYSGITDQYDKLEEIDITDYDLTDNQDQLELFDKRCDCQGDNNFCFCIS